MVGGIRVAGDAMANAAVRHDVISHNLANVSTPGFARELTRLELDGASERASLAAPRVIGSTDFTPGPPVVTGNPLDIFLEGSGFLSLETARGERYTRTTSLQVGPEGVLRTPEGLAVLGEEGQLLVGDGRVSIEKDGAVYVDGAFLDRLKLSTFRRGEDLAREEGGLWRATDTAQTTDQIARPVVHTGQTEGSAVQAVEELVRMIRALRAYEAAASAVRSQDTTLERAVSDVARF